MSSRIEKIGKHMSEKQSTFTVTDRRKFTLDGELRDPASAEEVHESAPAVVEARRVTILSPPPPQRQQPAPP